MKNLKRCFQVGVFLLIPLLQAACAQTESTGNAPVYSLETTDSQVRYEHVNERGEITQDTWVDDPLRATYDQGIWQKSNDSKTVNLNSAPVANRIHLVFVGDGYTKSEMPLYANDVRENLERLMQQEPFRSYQNYFAYHRVDVVSAESGVTTAGAPKKTALQMNYHCQGIPRLLCANVQLVSAQAQNAERADLIFAMANSSEYGGAGYMKPALSTFAARNPAALELALHEFAHSFAGLTDEYDSSGVSSKCTSFANTSAEDRGNMLSKKSKWFRWLDLSHVGSFEGSCYSKKYFRPTSNSKMRSLGRPFEEVNTEQLILSLYRRVKPIESSLKPGTYAAGPVWIKPAQPTGRSLAISWTINGVEQKNWKSKTTVDIRDLLLRNGTYKVEATVVDDTTAVRDESARAELMTQKVSWKLKIKSK